MSHDHDDVLHFREDPPAPPSDSEPWKILIVDDEEEMHGVTKLALTDFRVHGRPLAPGDVPANVVRGQYTAGEVAEEQRPAYRHEKKVAPEVPK